MKSLLLLMQMMISCYFSEIDKFESNLSFYIELINIQITYNILSRLCPFSGMINFSSNQTVPIPITLIFNILAKLFPTSKPSDISHLLLDRCPCPNGMRIVGRWCHTLCKEAKETLESVPIWFIVLLCACQCCPRSGGIPF